MGVVWVVWVDCVELDGLVELLVPEEVGDDLVVLEPVGVEVDDEPCDDGVVCSLLVVPDGAWSSTVNTFPLYKGFPLLLFAAII